MILVDCEAQVDFSLLRQVLGCSKLEFVQEETLQTVLQTYAGNVSIFQTLYDKAQVQVLFDDFFEPDFLLAFHPFYNGDSIFLQMTEVLSYMDKIHHDYRILHIPKKESSLKRTP